MKVLMLSAKYFGIFVVICVAFLFVVYGVSHVYVRDIEYRSLDSVPNKPVAIVLGTTPYTNSGGMNEYFLHRIAAAVDLYRAGKIQEIIVSGDTDSAYYNEPQVMRDMLVEAGVPESVIVLDDAGKRTLDTIIRARDVFGVTEAIFISQEFHLDRVLTIAKWYGIDAVGYVARDPSLLLPRARMFGRELFARVLMVVDMVNYNYFVKK